jgi:energy-coupling factor transporter transmembrane protein EcfT
MKPRTLLLLVILLAIAGIAVLNWNTFIAPSDLSLGVTTVRIPLGLVMLGLLVLLTVLFLLFVVYLQSSALLETRRHSRELQAHRELADQAEASRFTSLRSFLEAELSKQTSLDAESRAAVLARIGQLEHAVRESVEQSGNSLAACIGELEDRLEKRGDSTD